MRQLWVASGLLLLISCDLIAPREERTRELVRREMQGINWNDVDQYPRFEDCEEDVLKEAQRRCFEDRLLTHFSATLGEFEFELSEDVEDTIYVDFLVEKDGSIAVLEVQEHPVLQEQIPEFNGIITQSLKSLPAIDPALKRGMPVNAKFRIPLELNTRY